MRLGLRQRNIQGSYRNIDLIDTTCVSFYGAIRCFARETHAEWSVFRSRCESGRMMDGLMHAWMDTQRSLVLSVPLLELKWYSDHRSCENRDSATLWSPAVIATRPFWSELWGLHSKGKSKILVIDSRSFEWWRRVKGWDCEHYKFAPFKTMRGTLIKNCVHQSYSRWISLYEVFLSWLSVVITDLFQPFQDQYRDL